MIVDKYLSRTYHARSYNCAHLVCEVWAELRGQAVANALAGFLTGTQGRKVVLSQLRAIKWLHAPQSPCIVLLQRVLGEPHVGLWINGKVLHITKQGAHYQPLDVVAFGFKRIGFFTC